MRRLITAAVQPLCTAYLGQVSHSPWIPNRGQVNARRELFAYMEGYYNRARMHSALGYLTPEQAEQRMAS